MAQEVARGFTASLVLTGSALAPRPAHRGAVGRALGRPPILEAGLPVNGITFLGISLPSFLLAIGGLWLLGLQWRIVPIAGMTTVGKESDIGDFLRHLALPVAILGFGYMAIFMRYTRASMLDVANSEYVTTARSKGLRGSVVLRRHTFRNAVIPVITLLGLSIPEVVGAAVVTESVFSWPGLGLMMTDGVASRDFLTIMGVTVLLAVVVLIANLLADIAYAYADPRIRYS